MRLRIWAFLSWAIKRSEAPGARGQASCERGVEKQNHGQQDANDRDQKADANTLRLPPENVGQHRTRQLQLFDVVYLLGDEFEIRRCEISSNDEGLGPALGIARNKHQE